jgi:DNA adenine methylase
MEGSIMHYCGSKAAIAPAMLHYMMRSIDDRAYVEPFLGGANVMCRVDTSIERYGNDYNPYIIALWQALQDGWVPPEFITKDEFDYIKGNMEITEPHLVGYARTVCTFSGYWDGGYRGITKNIRNGSKVRMQNRQRGARINLLAQVPGMSGVILTSGDYLNMNVPRNSLVYCDPPYYASANEYIDSPFDWEQFWQWCRELAAQNVLVFVSEYTHPSDFVPIWTEPVTYERGQLYGQKHVNKLVVWEQQIDKVHTAPPTIPRMRIP